jgi:hypothetical protein
MILLVGIPRADPGHGGDACSGRSGATSRLACGGVWSERQYARSMIGVACSVTVLVGRSSPGAGLSAAGQVLEDEVRVGVADLVEGPVVP